MVKSHRNASAILLPWLCLFSPAWGQDKAITELSLKSTRALADRGDVHAQYDLGLMYSTGRGVPADYSQAITWFRKAAERGNADAQLSLARLYANGLGAPQDYLEAVKWFRMAADQGNAEAQFNLGLMYSKGDGVAKDDTQAASWFRKAAQQGNVNAQLQLGLSIEKAKSAGPKSEDEAIQWFRKAADQGNATAQVKIGLKYKGGTGGIPKDNAEAAEWFSKAAEQGNASAQSNLVEMYKQGTVPPATAVKSDVAHWAHKLAAAEPVSGPASPSAAPPSPASPSPVPPPPSSASGSNSHTGAVFGAATDGSDIPEIAKKDCQTLVDGQLVFAPSQTMRQGQASSVFARLSRNSGVEITQGLTGADFIIVKEKVSCQVAMSLDSVEEEAFTIDKVPQDRSDAQLLEPDGFSQWDWRVTPLKHGPLHLLLYVTPMLYVDGVGEQLKEFRQPPREITVNPDYIYESTQFVKSNWAIISGIPVGAIFLWFRKQIYAWFRTKTPGQENS